jgi:hypothetical protein
VLSRYIAIVDEGFQARRRTDQTIVGAGLDLVSATLHDSNGAECYVYPFGSGLDVRVRLEAHNDLPNCHVSIGISDGRQGPLASCSMLQDGQGIDLRAGGQTITCRLKNLPLAPRNYEVWAAVRDAGGTVEVLPWSQVAVFRVGELVEGEGAGSTTQPWLAGPVRIEHGWLLEA